MLEDKINNINKWNEAINSKIDSTKLNGIMALYLGTYASTATSRDARMFAYNLMVINALLILKDIKEANQYYDYKNELVRKLTK